MNQGISSNWQSGQWTGTQAGEGQSGIGPSSLSGQNYSQFGGNLPPWTRAGGMGQGWGGQVQPQSNWQSGQWTGTQYGEGQPGMGGSSLAQNASWQSQSSFGGTGGQGLSQNYSQFGGNLPAWTRSSNVGQQAWGGQQPQGNFSSGRWTGTQYGEGQGGMGGSSLASSAHWPIGNQSSFAGQGFSGQGWTGTQYGEGQPGMGGSSLAQSARWSGQSNVGSNWQGQGVGDQQQAYLPPWTRNTQSSQGQ